MATVSNSRALRVIPLLIAVCLVSFPAQAQYGGGTGELNDPYLIYTAEQMNAIDGPFGVIVRQGMLNLPEYC